MAQHEFILPVPPSANLLWRVFPVKTKNGKVGFRPVPSKAYDAWKREAGPFLPEADKDLYIENPRLGWGFWLWANIDHASDLDNRIKATVDLVAGHCGLSDKWLNEIHVYRTGDVPSLAKPLPKNMGCVYIRTERE